MALQATFCVTSDRLIPQPGGKTFTVRYHDDKRGDGVMSVQPDGSIQWRAVGTAGPWETCRRVDNRLLFTDSGYPVGGFIVAVSD